MMGIGVTAAQESLELLAKVRILDPQYASKALTAMHWSCKPENPVRLRIEAYV
jgi:hypothetical protein